MDLHYFSICEDIIPNSRNAHLPSFQSVADARVRDRLCCCFAGAHQSSRLPEAAAVQILHPCLSSSIRKAD